MCLVFIILARQSLFASATTVPRLSSRDDEANFLPQDTRTVSSIVFSCFFTLLACIWCCIRPDLSSPTDSKLRILRTKLNIIFWVFLAPELVLFWAYRQWYEAGKIAEEYKGRGWTRTQALFLIMGGFMLYKDDRPYQTLSIQRFRILHRAGAIDFPSSVTAQSISNLGSMNPMLAFLITLQCIWFTTQFISRLVVQLPVTQLELCTFALLLINAAILGFWWFKPLDVGRHIRIDTRFDLRRAPIPEPGPRTIKDDYKREVIYSKQIKQIFEAESYQPTLSTSSSYASRFLKWLLRMSLVWPLQSLYQDVGRLSVCIQSSTIAEGALSVPLFYCPDTTDFLQFALLPALGIGTLFGGVHCLFLISSSTSASFGHFPSDMAMHLWRLASVTAAGFTALFLLLLLLVLATQLWNQLSFMRLVVIIANFFVYLGICLFLSTFLLFVVARMGVLVLSLVFLKDLPQDALRVLRWTNYIPHFA